MIVGGGGWTTQLKNMLVKLDHSSNFGLKHETSLKPPPPIHACILSWRELLPQKETISIENRCLSEDFKNRTSRWLRIQLRDSCFKQLLMLKDMKCPIFSAKFNWTLGAFFALSSHSSTKRNKKHKRKSWTRSGENWSKVLYIFWSIQPVKEKKQNYWTIHWSFSLTENIASYQDS